MANPKTTVETTVVQNVDGSTTKTIVTTTVDTRPDGSRSTRKRTQTITEGIPVPSSSHSSKSGVLSLDEASKLMAKAKRVQNTTCKKFIAEALRTHNKLRYNHGIGPLQLDEDLNSVSQAWANHLAKVKGKMEHSANGCGENLFWTNALNVTGKHVVESWYSEMKDFDWENIDSTPGTGHFTQLLWKDSIRLGVALAEGKTGFYAVASYDPPGNVLGKYADNIFPPK